MRKEEKQFDTLLLGAVTDGGKDLSEGTSVCTQRAAGASGPPWTGSSVANTVLSCSQPLN